MCNFVEWDPSGRILASAVVLDQHKSSSMRYQLENGYALWTFQGTQLVKTQKTNFYQFLWRPRPRSLLSAEEVSEVYKNLKSYIARYKESDRLQSNMKQLLATKEKVEKRDKFRAYVASRQELYRSQRNDRIAVFGCDPDAEDYSIEEVDVEEVLHVEEIPF